MPAAYGLRGRIATMDAGQVLDDGVVYWRGETIVDVRHAQDPPPTGFSANEIVALPAGATVFPGLIELHNHLSYNVLPLWQVDKLYGDRAQWRTSVSYTRAVAAPIRIVADTPAVLPALVRYVEAKALCAGTTTSQGITLKRPGTTEKYFNGTMRVVERAEPPSLPAAKAEISDIDPAGLAAFYREQKNAACFLLHLAEGTDAAARKHFTDLSPDGGQTWGIARSLAGIHSLALQPGDFDVLAKCGASVVWSPLSNLMLYGRTIDAAAVRAKNIRLGLGSDWSFSGSKNLLAEMKVVAAIRDAMNLQGLSDEDIVKTVTTEAAAILGWSGHKGSLAAAQVADMVVISKIDNSPYHALLSCHEDSIAAVIIGGRPCYGDPAILAALGMQGEQLTVGGTSKAFSPALSSDPDIGVGTLSLAAATATLKSFLANLPQQAQQLIAQDAATEAAAGGWSLALDDQAVPNVGAPLHTMLASLNVSASSVVQAITLDTLTVADDRAAYQRALQAQPNIPTPLRSAIVTAFS